MIAVLAHEETTPELITRDISELRARGWRDLSLDELEEQIRSHGPRDRYFHVTTAGTGIRCGDVANAISELGSSFTAFVSMGAMPHSHRALIQSSVSQASLQDQTFDHRRAFHFRKVLCFHSQQAPNVDARSEFDLAEGDPVCISGSEIARPRFTVDPAASALCREVAERFTGPRGVLKWTETIKSALRRAGLGWDQFGPMRKAEIKWTRLGRFCIKGSYESPVNYRRRVADYITGGRDSLARFAGRPPIAFAHPWGEGSQFVDRLLQRLGYRFSFSGLGLMTTRRLFGIPRIFITTATPRPLDLISLGNQNRPQGWRLMHALRPLLYA